MHCLRRIPRRLFEVLIGDLQVVFRGDRTAVSNPRTDHVGRVLTFKLNLRRTA